LRRRRKSRRDKMKEERKGKGRGGEGPHGGEVVDARRVADGDVGGDAIALNLLRVGVSQGRIILICKKMIIIMYSEPQKRGKGEKGEERASGNNVAKNNGETSSFASDASSDLPPPPRAQVMHKE